MLMSNWLLACSQLCVEVLLFFDNVDIDQCSVNNGECDQMCTNLLPGFVCSCYKGYTLNSDDGKSCSGTRLFIDCRSSFLVKNLSEILVM